MANIVFALVLVLLLTACSQPPVSAGEVRSDAAGETAVDFFQEGERIGGLFVRAGSARNGFVSFLVEMSYAGSDYRLDSLTLEFRSEAPAPTIMLEASSGSLTENISFHRLDGDHTRLAIPDTGQSGDGTVLLEFMASADAFGANGQRLHAELGFGVGDAATSLVIRPAP